MEQSSITIEASVEYRIRGFSQIQILFYREHRSVEAVAAELELSEDAMKQRLSRGRKLAIPGAGTGATEDTCDLGSLYLAACGLWKTLDVRRESAILTAWC